MGLEFSKQRTWQIMKYKCGTIVLVLFMSTAVMAEPSTTAPAVPKNLHIYNANGNAYVDMTPHGCSGSRYSLSPEHAKYDAIISILLAAQLAGNKVVIRYDGCNSIQQGNIIGVYLP